MNYNFQYISMTKLCQQMLYPTYSYVKISDCSSEFSLLSYWQIFCICYSY